MDRGLDPRQGVADVLTVATCRKVGRAAPAAEMKKAPGRRVHDQDHKSARSFLVLVHPSATDLSSRTLRYLARAEVQQMLASTPSDCGGW